MVALRTTLGQQEWDVALRPLLDSDVRGMNDGLNGESEGHRSLSWIWRTGFRSAADGHDLDDEGLHEGSYFFLSHLSAY